MKYIVRAIAYVQIVVMFAACSDDYYVNTEKSKCHKKCEKIGSDGFSIEPYEGANCACVFNLKNKQGE